MELSSPPLMDAFPVGDDLVAALECANVPTLLLVLAHLTGEERWLDPPYRPAPPRGPGDQDDAGHPPDLQAEIRASVVQVLGELDAGDRTPASAPDSDTIVRWLSKSLGTEVDPLAGPLFAEELGLADRWVDVPGDPAATGLDVVIIGSGYSGLAAAIALQRAGVPYRLIEKNHALGGTWLENTYPGCGVDTPSHMYSFSYAQNAAWPKYFGKRQELYAYLEGVAERQDVLEHVRYGLEVKTTTWDEEAQRWRIVAAAEDGSFHDFDARIVISAVGLLNRPSVPDIPGLDTFSGPSFHTARWEQDVTIEGKRVGVVGTGASAMQLVPAIAGVADHVTVFQRSPQWGIPHPNYKRDVGPEVRWLMAELPHYGGWYRARLHWNNGDRLHPSLKIDPEWPHLDRSINEQNERHRKFLTKYILDELGDRTDLIEKCVPDYPPYGKRPLLDNQWFRTVRRADVSLVTERVTAVEPEGVITADGEHHDVDVLVLATGFQALNMLGPLTVVGRSGTPLREVWGTDDARAYLGMSIPDYPNFFVLWGPNTNAGHGGSHVLSVELQVRYIMETVAAMSERGIGSVECRREVFAAYNEKLDDALSRTIWTHGGMNTYYRNSAGRIVYNMPWTNAEYWHMVRRPELERDFVVRHRGSGVHAEA